MGDIIKRDIIKMGADLLLFGQAATGTASD
jgi:hypothetical protein